MVNDLAIGFSPNGFDAWSFQDELAAGMSVGPRLTRWAPWGLGPAAFVPDRLAASGTSRSRRPSGPAWPTPPACASTT